jgi:hypothetical protein
MAFFPKTTCGCAAELGPQKNLEALLREIDVDPTCIFWG